MEETPLDEARRLLSSLESAIQAAGRLPAGHPQRTAPLRQVLRSLEVVRPVEGPLELVIRPEGVFLERELLLPSEEGRCDLSRLLHPEGVRLLALHPGLTPDELGWLVEVLARGDATSPADPLAPPGSGRLLAALWAGQPEHVSWRIYDPLAPHATQAFREPTLAPVAERVARQVELLTGAAARGAGDPHAYLDRLDADWAARHPAPAEPAARVALRARIQSHRLGDDLERLGQLLTAALEPGEERLSEATAGRVLADALRLCLSQHAHEVVREALEAQAGLLEHAELRGQLSAVLGSRSGLVALLDALAGSPSASGEELLVAGYRVLRRLDPGRLLPAVAAVYPDVEHEDLRRLLRRVLGAHADEVVGLLEPLTRHPKEQLAREAVGILALGSEGGAARARLQTLSRGDGPRAGLAREALDVVTGEQRRRSLLQAVRDGQDAKERIRAAAALKTEGNAQSFEELCHLVSEPLFAQRGEDELNVVFDALVGLGGLRAVRILTELSERKTRFFVRKEVEKVRGLAAGWLELLRQRRKSGEGRA